MKKGWICPVINLEQFASNEYVSACWKIECNVPLGFGFIDNNRNGRYDWGDTPISDIGSGCGVWHAGIERDANDVPKANSMWQPVYPVYDWDGTLLGYNYSGAAYAVFHWSTSNDPLTGQHFSKVNDARWETNKNAS